jgi:hypothetical protein
MVKPPALKITSFGVGLTGNVTPIPRTVIVKSAIEVDPVAEGAAVTEDVEVINPELRLKIKGQLMESVLMVDVADPVPVPVSSPITLVFNTSVVRLTGPKLELKEGSDAPRS